MKDIASFRDLAKRFPVLAEALNVEGVRSVPFVQQLSATDCGIACLSMVLKYHGRVVNLERLRDMAVSARDATNAQALIDTGRCFGLNGKAVALEVGQVEYLPKAAILHWEFTHFVVFERITKKGVTVVDPKRGRWIVPLDRFRRSFTGVAILFEPNETFTTGGEPSHPVRRYLGYILSERAFFPHILAASLLLQIFGLGTPLLSRFLIDRVVPHHDYELLGVLAVAALLVTVFQACTALVRSLLLLYLRARLDSRITVGFLGHLLSLPFDFFQRRSAGDLMTRLGTNTTVRELLTSTLMSAALDGSLALGYLVVLLAISPTIAVLTLALASIQAAVFLVSRRQQRQFIAQALDAQGKLQGYLVEILSAVETLKSFGAEDRALQRWTALYANELNVSIKRGRLDAILESLTSALRTMSSMVLLGATAMYVLADRMTLGDMVAVSALAGAFLGPVMNLVGSATRLQLLGVYLERLEDVLQTPAEHHEPDLPSPPLAGCISAQNVSFRYSAISDLVIRSVSTEIASGEFVAIVGRSGSGKSTLAKLLVGLYVPTEGTIAYDGICLRQRQAQSVRRQIGVVTQQAQLFSGTVRSNIALTDPGLSMERIIEAAKLAHIHDDIMAMPMGYDTALIDRGASLSGGQQQRVCLARAIVREPRILLLDEATNQLDAATEQTVQLRLATLNCSRLVIAHRLSTIMHADRILVMENGALVEEGNHESLLARGGTYAGLIVAQRSDAPHEV